ncbi:hypothetical protein [Paramagnetospirillum caucaseum]|uniref:hypothetical protein n=1 Tax=Paramagnetospirillum caucaseum TaxID=1244869 RepID=UPI00058D17D7|nr:hypothetical protein [Paramagnetospirillum caucaseum]
MERIPSIRTTAKLVVGTLLALLALGWAGIFLTAYFSTSWKGTTDQEFAVRAAHSVSPVDVADRCGGKNDINNPACFSPTQGSPAKYCRWWILEDCIALEIPETVLQDASKLGLTIDAAINPCKYLLQKKEFIRSHLHEDCAQPDKMWHPAVILVFKGARETIRIRID